MPSSQSAKKSAVTATDQRYIVPGLERGLKLLQLFDRGRTVLGAAEVARALEVPRSSAFRLIQTLEYLGYLERTGNDYRLGPAVLRLGFEYVAALPITELARPILANLRDECGCTAQLALRDQREVVYVMHVLGPSHFSSNVSVGTRLPVHATALGRMFLAYMRDQAISALYAGSTLQRFSNRTTITVNGLIERAHADRARGVAISESHFEAGISAIAAAVLDGHAVPVAALSITLLQPALPATPQAEHLIDAVRNAAAELSHRLNYRAQPLVAPMAGDRAARSHANGRSALGDTLIHRA